MKSFIGVPEFADSHPVEVLDDFGLATEYVHAEGQTPHHDDGQWLPTLLTPQMQLRGQPTPRPAPPRGHPDGGATVRVSTATTTSRNAVQLGVGVAGQGVC
jgi:hypothetical protein